jgi:hypothetical protein
MATTPFLMATTPFLMGTTPLQQPFPALPLFMGGVQQVRHHGSLIASLIGSLQNNFCSVVKNLSDFPIAVFRVKKRFVSHSVSLCPSR